jgi:hypothetical protein
LPGSSCAAASDQAAARIKVERLRLKSVSNVGAVVRQDRAVENDAVIRALALAGVPARVNRLCLYVEIGRRARRAADEPSSSFKQRLLVAWRKVATE